MRPTANAAPHHAPRPSSETPEVSPVQRSESSASFRPAPDAPRSRPLADVATEAPGSQRVLLVDDEPDVLHGLSRVLEGAGYNVTCASSLRHAVQAMRRERFHLVLTDLYLGATDLGVQIAAVARERRPHTPVIVLTARPSFDGAQEALRNHVADLVVKPVEAQQLLATCRRVVQETELARRNQELESANRVLTSVLPRTIEVKDPTTSGHAARVVGYTDALARRCGVSAEDRASLRLAALLHDIGKIGVEDAILGKPGRLTEAEFRKLQLHPVIGHDILKGIKNLQHILPGVRSHHESYDGSGYPDKLSGDDIPLMARILAVADAFDAMGSDRPYRGGMPLEQIERILVEGSGTQWDARVIRAYFAAREDVRRIWETCRESAEPRVL